MRWSAHLLRRAVGYLPSGLLLPSFLGGAALTLLADTALRLAAYIGTTPEFWLNLQLRYDLNMARQRKDLVEAVRAIRPYAGRDPSTRYARSG